MPCSAQTHERRLVKVLVAVAVGLLFTQSNARDSSQCCIVNIASYSNFGDLIVKRNIK